MTDNKSSAQEFHRVRAERERRERKMRMIAAGAFTLVAVLALVVFGASVALNEQNADTTSMSSAAYATKQQTLVEQGNWPTSGTTTVTDSTGREVKVPAYPKSIAIMDSFAGEYAVMAGAGSRIYGVPGGVKSAIILKQIYPELSSECATLSGSTVNIEDMMAANCDVAIVKVGMGDAELAKLDKFKIPYVVVGYTTVDEQLAAMELVGKVLGGPCTEKSDKLIAFYQGLINDTASRVSTVSDAERLRVYHTINSPTTTDSAASLGASWIEKAGCVNVSAHESTVLTNGDYDATLDQVYVWNPDLIINSSYTTTDQILGDAQWASLRAVRDGHVITIPVGATRWGQRGSVETALAMIWLGKTAYPNLFEDVDLKKIVVDHYRDALGVSLDDAAYEAIIAGREMREVGNGSGSGSGGGTGGGNGGGKK